MHKNSLFNNRLLSIWGLNSTLQNYFQNIRDPNYGEKEIEDLIKLFDRDIHPQKDIIIDLLRETQKFLFASTQEAYFKEGRERALNEKDFLGILDLMGNAIINVENKCTPLNQEQHTVLLDAKDYCVKSIEKQLQGLHRAQDQIYTVYSTKDNVLKRALTSHSNNKKPL